MDVAASEFKVEGQDCYDLGTWYPDAENLGGVLGGPGAVSLLKMGYTL